MSMTELRSPVDAEAMLEVSRSEPVALLKHSVTCPVSAYGRQEFMRLVDLGDIPLYVVVVQYARAVSAALEAELGVRHESPQALILYEGTAVFHQNHGRIRATDLYHAAQRAVRPAA